MFEHHIVWFLSLSGDASDLRKECYGFKFFLETHISLRPHIRVRFLP